MVSILKGMAGAMQFFSHDGFDLAFVDRAPHDPGEPVLLIHGFGSTHAVNWVAPGWMKTLGDAGYRVIALDNRGHGASTKSYEAEDYAPQKMAADAAALLGHLGIERAHVFGYSMGARIAAFLALQAPQSVATLVFGGLGSAMFEGGGDWDLIAEALVAADPDSITSERARMFRAFADQTKSDRKALAACIKGSRTAVAMDDIARIEQPVLVAAGTRDDLSGSPERLARMLPNGVSFAIEGRDHMLSVGDRTFKARVVDFLREHSF